MTDIVYQYDRLGRKSAITDGTGSRVFGYDPDTLLETTETITGDASAVIIHRYNATGSNKGKAYQLEIGSTGYLVEYAYDDYGRMNNVNYNIGGLTDNAVDAYVPNSDLLKGLVTTCGRSTVYGYEPGRGNWDSNYYRQRNLSERR